MPTKSKNITIENKGKLVRDKLKLTWIFNTNYIKIVKNSSGIPPSITGNPNTPLEDSNTVKNIIEVYKNHPSIINIRNQTNLNANAFDFPHATAEEINKIIKDINSKKELLLIRFHLKLPNFQQTLLIRTLLIKLIRILIITVFLKMLKLHR